MAEFVKVFIPTKGTELTSNRSQLLLVRTLQKDKRMSALSVQQIQKEKTLGQVTTHWPMTFLTCKN